jgi:acyl-[acyl-carrier-protein]-phospholipid O-acyltransferase/long-chain-fatty-acid--[acyl-carrier-protein] ligase
MFKLLIIAFIVGRHESGLMSSVSSTAGAVFVVPFLLFSAFAGKLADRFSKRDIVIAAKTVEVIVMVVGLAAFILKIELALYGALFLMAAQSAFFSPSKYGIVPELVRKEHLSRANSFLEALTYLSVVIGAVLVPVLLYATNKHYGVAGLACAFIAAAGLLASLRIERTQASGDRQRASVFFVRDIWRTLGKIRARRDLFLAVMAAAYFLLIGAFIQLNILSYALNPLGFDETQGGYLFLPGAVGIGVGAYLAGRLSGRNVEFGLVPLAALGLTCTSVGLGLISGNLYAVLALIFVMGASAGMFIVPIHAFIQLRSPRRRRGQIIAASNFLGWGGVLLASGLIYVFGSLLSMSAPQLFVVLGVMTLALTVATIILLPDFLVRFLCLLLVRLCYRLRVVGIENVPVEGGALLVCNHASLVDAPLLAATQQRRIRFAMDRDIYNRSWLKPVFKLMGVIPISGSDPPKMMIQSLRKARAAMNEGFIVCIFAEGAMTRTGMPQAFKRGVERIMRGSDYDIIPVYLGGAWGSIFSYYYGKPLSTLPRKFPYQVSIHFGRPMPADSTAGRIRQSVLELSCKYFESLKPSRRSLADHFIQVARKNRRSRSISDATGRRLSYGKTLASAVALSAQIDRLTRGQEKVGVLLPPSIGGVLANVAITMLGKAPVNLNYVVSEAAREFAIEQCGIKCIISSRAFVEKLEGLGTLPGLVFLEDIVAGLGFVSKLKAYLQARFVPRRFLTGRRRFCADDLATVIFTSGSSGNPKGVMLSHHNIISNIEGARMVFRLKPEDNVCAVLPFFHSFGFTCTLWLPLLSGVPASYVANPLDGAAVGRTARENRSTLLFATPTFLLNYVRKAEREDFAGLRMVVVGAEKLKASVADAFENKFAIRPVEGYGATELSPVVSLNLPDVDLGGVYQVGSKPGAVGHPIPGVAVKIVDVESGHILAAGKEGLLMVKGPNVMLGYLNMEKETARVMKDGWYNTGDIGRTDEDGFLTLTDRLSRFSKIGGEMVPHLGVEQVYLDGLGASEQLVAVTSVPAAKKGEELVVLYLDEAGDRDRLHKIISQSRLPNLWKPRRDNYVKIGSMPVLGSGKLDVMGLRKIALAAKSDCDGR